jgi:hypothetical protein
MKLKRTTLYGYFQSIENNPTGIDVLTAVIVNCIIFWDLKPCSLVEVHGRFGGSYSCHLLLACFFPGLPFDPENGGSMFLRNVRKILPDYKALHHRRL